MPSSTERQREFMGAELARKRAGKKTKTGMSEEQLSEFASKPIKKTRERTENYYGTYPYNEDTKNRVIPDLKDKAHQDLADLRIRGRGPRKPYREQYGREMGTWRVNRDLPLEHAKTVSIYKKPRPSSKHNEKYSVGPLEYTEGPHGKEYARKYTLNKAEDDRQLLIDRAKAKQQSTQATETRRDNLKVLNKRKEDYQRLNEQRSVSKAIDNFVNKQRTDLPQNSGVFKMNIEQFGKKIALDKLKAEQKQHNKKVDKGDTGRKIGQKVGGFLGDKAEDALMRTKIGQRVKSIVTRKERDGILKSKIDTLCKSIENKLGGK